MGAVLMRVRTELRAGWRAWLALALILGVSAGAAIAAAAGARRTATAYPRFLRAQDAFDAVTGGGGEEGYEEHFAAVEKLPMVKDLVVIRIIGGELTLPARRGRPEQVLTFPEIFIDVEPTGTAFYSVNRAKVLEGRLADRSVVNEAMVPFSLADRYDLRVGDRVIAGIGFSEEFKPAERVPLDVVGITVAPGEFDAVGQTSFLSLHATPAFFERYRDLIPEGIPDLQSHAVHVRAGARSVQDFKDTVEQDLNIDVPFIEPTVTAGVQKTMRLYAAALWLLGALIAVASVAIFGQTLARQIFLDSADYPALRALGLSRAQLFATGMARALAIGLVAVPVAGAVAFALSPLAPIGTARIAEPDPGFAFDGIAIAVGLGVTLLAVLVLAAWPALRAARLASVPFGSPLDRTPSRPSRVVAGAARTSTSPSAVTGLRMALEPGRGRTAVPVRSTILAVALGIAAVTATVVVGRSLSHLIATPALTGFTYDAIVPGEEDSDDTSNEQRLAAFPFVETTVGGTGLNIDVEGVASFLVGFDQGRPIGFAVIEARAPTDQVHSASDCPPEQIRCLPEIAVGPATLRRLGLGLGETISFTYPFHEEGSEDGVRRTQRGLIVGSAAIPPLPWAATEPGEGAVMTVGSIRTFSPDEGGCCFVRFKPGTDLNVARATLEEAGFMTFLRTKRADLVTLERITGLPLILSGIFGAMAVAALAHVLVTGIRRRRRDLAILKTIGFVKRQVRGAVAWQSSAIAVVCVLVGIPAGIVLGRWGWRSVADQFGVVPVPVVPVPLLALVVPAALVLANLIAMVPARAAARTEPAVVLRTE